MLGVSRRTMARRLFIGRPDLRRCDAGVEVCTCQASLGRKDIADFPGRLAAWLSGCECLHACIQTLDRQSPEDHSASIALTQTPSGNFLLAHSNNNLASFPISVNRSSGPESSRRGYHSPRELDAGFP